MLPMWALSPLFPTLWLKMTTHTHTLSSTDQFLQCDTKGIRTIFFLTVILWTHTFGNSSQEARDDTPAVGVVTIPQTQGLTGTRVINCDFSRKDKCGGRSTLSSRLSWPALWFFTEKKKKRRRKNIHSINLNLALKNLWGTCHHDVKGYKMTNNTQQIN